MRKAHRIAIVVSLGAAAACGVVGPGGAAPSGALADRPRPAFCKLPPRAEKLPPGALRGLAHHLHQYPTLSLATRSQRAAAKRLLARARAAARAWPDPGAADAAGFDTRPARRAAGNGSIGYLHAEHRRTGRSGGYLDPLRPKALIYANVPGRPLALVGVMFSMPRGLQGANPGGPITRWHWHRVCARGKARGVKPRPDGSCPPGARIREGSEMLHLWFTRDLRSAFAIHAPEPELCTAGLLPTGRCA